MKVHFTLPESGKAVVCKASYNTRTRAASEDSLAVPLRSEPGRTACYIA